MQQLIAVLIIAFAVGVQILISIAIGWLAYLASRAVQRRLRGTKTR